MSSSSIIDTPLFGAYAERATIKEGKLERYFRRLGAIWPSEKKLSKQTTLIERVSALRDTWEGASDENLRQGLDDAVVDIRTAEMDIATVAPLMAILREVSGRTLGKRYFDVQLLGAWAILNGNIAEMETGEGKTLTASLAAAIAALSGAPVHVISVNDYLVERDAADLSPFYHWLGLSGYDC